MNELTKIILSTLAAFVALFIIAKLGGKKQISQLEFIDYVIGISIGSIAAEMATANDKPIYYYLIAMGLFFLLDFSVTFLSRKAVFLKRILNGMPLILIDDGKIDYKNLKKSKIDINELLCLCRIKGFFSLKDVSYCIMEINGDVSILPAAQATPVVIKDIKTEFKIPKLSSDVIIDGKIINKALLQNSKSRKWLLDKLNIIHKKQLKNILLATLEGEEIVVHTKK